MEQQVLSIEQMQHLQELGVDTSKAKICWCKYIGYDAFVMPISETYIGQGVWEMTPTFTLQDILEMMPHLLFGKYFFNINKSSHKWWFIKYTDYLANDDYEFFHGSNLLEVAYQCLCWLAENEYLKGGEK